METQDDSRLHFLTYLLVMYRDPVFFSPTYPCSQAVVHDESKEASDNFQKDKAEFYQRNFL